MADRPPDDPAAPDTVEREPVAMGGTASVRPPSRRRLHDVLAAIAGPALIVGTALFAMRGFALGGRISTADLLSFWYPNYCFLGSALTAGHIPAWNPHLMGGVPFAADPQSGWLYLPAMVLFSALPCGTAMGWMVGIQPVLAGLGLYWFGRSEGLGRPAATVGGLALTMAMAGSNLVLSMPFSGTLAWTALTLAALSRAVRASGWPGRLGWGGAAAVAWGQLLSAHFSVGALLGTGVLLAYLAGAAWGLVRSGTWGRRAALLAFVLAGLMAVSVNAAVIVPRLAYLPSTNVSLGYHGMRRLEAEVLGKPEPRDRVGKGTTPSWPLNFAASPGPHAGALVLVMAFAGWWARKRRGLVLAFSAYGAALFVLGLTSVAARVPAALRSFRPIDLYLHNPQWLSFQIPVVLAILAALGLQAWLDEPDARRRVLMVVSGLLVWGAVPLLLGAPPGSLALLGVGIVAGGALLAAVAISRSRVLVALLPPLLALELLANLTISGPKPPFATPGLLTTRLAPALDAASYLEPGPVTEALRRFDDRYARVELLAPTERAPERGTGLIPNHAVFFSIDNAGGYNPVQPLRYWLFVRASQHTTQKYNRASFTRKAPPSALDLLQVGSILATEPVPGADPTPLATQGRWAVYRRSSVVPRASLVTSWEVVQGSRSALERVAADGFDPEALAILEQDPGIGEPAAEAGGAAAKPTGSVTYTPAGDQEARIDVRSDTPGVLVVRTTGAPHWHAELDGRDAPVLAVDHVLQGVAIPPGVHRVVLRYDDPWIGLGLAGSALSLAALAVLAVFARRRVMASG